MDIKKYLILIVLFFCPFYIFSQTKDEIKDEQIQETKDGLENLNLENDNENTITIEDDRLIYELEDLQKRYVNFNNATQEQIEKLYFLTPLQIENILFYRKKMGLLISKYELQAIPDLDSLSIQNILSVFNFDSTHSIKYFNQQYFVSAIYDMPTPMGFSNGAYAGPNLKMQSRYKFQSTSYKGGICLEQDPGEAYLINKNQILTDHISFYIQKNFKKGLLKSLVLGNYTIQIGQGLAQWQRFTMNQSMGATFIKRMSPIVSTFCSSMEFNYNRGIALNLQKNTWNASLWASYINQDATILSDTNQYSYFENFSTTGLHRTASEIAKRNTSHEIQTGMYLEKTIKALKIGIYGIYNKLPQPLVRNENYYNFYQWQGDHIAHTGLYYNFRKANWNSFGEAVVQDFKNYAFNFGNLFALDKKLELALYYIQHSKEYQAQYNNAFLQNQTCPTQSMYIGFDYHHSKVSNFSIYVDKINYLQAKYLIPSLSHEWETGAIWRYNFAKKTQLYLRLNYRIYPKSTSNTSVKEFEYVTQNQGKISLRKEISPRFKLATTMYYSSLKTGASTTYGYAFSQDITFSTSSNWKFTTRLSLFDNEDFSNRIYLLEPNLPYTYSLVFYNGKGFRLIEMVQKKIKNVGNFYFRYAIEKQPNNISSGSGNTLVLGNLYQTFSFQYQWNSKSN